MAFKAVVSVGNKYSEIWIRKNRSKGVKPYVDPLPYKHDNRKIFMFKNPNLKMSSIYDTAYRDGDNVRWVINEDVLGYDMPRFIPSLDRNAAHNKALGKVSDQLEYVTNLFEAWYERREAYTLMFSCVRAIHTFAKRWKDPSYWKKMRKAFKTNVKNPASLPEAWLLWQFALKPLILTIDDVMNLLTSPMPIYWVEGASGFNGSYFAGSKTRMMNEGPHLQFKYDYIVKHGVRVVGLNPNAQLANILGLTTPISSFLDVVPWFWAVNYFVNVNDLVSNFENRFPGVKIDKSYTTVLIKTHGSGTYNVNALHSDNRQYPDKTDFWWPVIDHTYMVRTVSTSVPRYKLSLSYPTLGSNQLANLTSAIALALKGKN